MKALFVCSSGGHLDQLLVLLPAPPTVEVVFATFLKPDAVEKIKDYKSYGLRWPTNRSLKAALINAFIAVRTVRKERPDVIVSSGAAAAVPFFLVGKLLRVPTTVYIECIDRQENVTLTARLVRPWTSMFLSQGDNQLSGFPRRHVVRASK